VPFVTERAGRLHGHKLEYNLADHCNLSCRECSHLSPYIRKHFASLESFERDLSRLAEVYRVHRFRFVGGEPLLNREIRRFVQSVRRCGIATEIEIVTNGLLLERLDEQLLQHIDSVVVSAYPAAGDLGPVLRATRKLCDRCGVRLRVEHIDRFRRMQVQGPITDPSFVRTTFDSCLIAHTWSCQTFYEGFFYLCSRPIYTDDYLRQLGAPPGNFRQVDGIALHEPELAARLLAYLRSAEPLSACRHCLGTVGKYEPHAQLAHMDRKHPSMPAAASESIDRGRLRRLLRWRRATSTILNRVPSLRLARLLAMAETAALGD
jgi:organic radical activating enzyme